MVNGTLYGIVVGPGDSEPITLKAAKILERVAVVFAAASTRNIYSLAAEIASPHLFIKSADRHYGELEAAARLHLYFEIIPMGNGFVKFGGREPAPEDIQIASEAWKFSKEKMASDEFDMIILDDVKLTCRQHCVALTLEKPPALMRGRAFQKPPGCWRSGGVNG